MLTVAPRLFRIVELLIKHGWNPRGSSKTGQIPLDLARQTYFAFQSAEAEQCCRLLEDAEAALSEAEAVQAAAAEEMARLEDERRRQMMEREQAMRATGSLM